QTDYPNGQDSALIRYDARLVRTDDKRVVASRRFEVSQPVDGKKVAAQFEIGLQVAVVAAQAADPAGGL
ncbi:hypothetical protein ACV34F_30560, partial [Pseudomonas aeruginosa]